jgi:hypothetical protein
VSKPLHCSIIKGEGDKNYLDIIDSCRQIAQFVERNTNIKMSEIVGDFIRDPSGTWWLLGIKAFVLEDTYAVPVLRHFLPNEEAMYEMKQKENLDTGRTMDDDPLLKNKKLPPAKIDNVKVLICRFC